MAANLNSTGTYEQTKLNVLNENKTPTASIPVPDSTPKNTGRTQEAVTAFMSSKLNILNVGKQPGPAKN